MKKPVLSVVIPFYNEKDNINNLYGEFNLLGKSFNNNLEIIFINDGSTDDTLKMLTVLQAKDQRIKLINFAKNFGQTAAFDAGIKLSTAPYIVTMDGDLQNDPGDIPKLLNEIEKGFDVVCGWRKERFDSFSKKIFSLLANFLRKSLTSESIHDSGCSLRIYRKKVFEGTDLYGEMHRFIPAILEMKGFKIGEIEVNHRNRKFGKSKYGFSRLFKGFVDLMFIIFLTKYANRPLHLFGAVGALTFISGFTTGLYLTVLKFLFHESLSNRPLLILSVLLMILGVQFFIFGILAEIMIRIYYKTHQMTPYTVKQ